MFSIRDLTFQYRVGARKVDVLKNLDLEVRKGDFIAIQGPSGSGKSTLFYILGFLLKPQLGRVSFEGKELTELGDDELAYIRNRKIGFIFQQFHLLPRASVLENILLPTHYPIEMVQKTAAENKRLEDKARSLAKRFGLEEHLHHSPNQLSGGQQQRVAIARALMNDVDLILADEPTGNLDSINARQILDLLNELNAEGKTIVLITHDGEVAKRCPIVYHMRDGRFELVEENRPQLAKTNNEAIELGQLPKPQGLLAHLRLAVSLLPLALDNLWRNKAKSLLTMIGVVIGVAAVLSMVTLGQFTKEKVVSSYEALGSNKLVIRGYQNWYMKATDQVGSNFQQFKNETDIEPLLRLFPEVRLISPYMYDSGLSGIAGGRTTPSEISSLGVSPEFLAISNRKILKGRNITPFHVQYRSPVCVIGLEVAQKLFSRVEPIGQILTLSDNRQTAYPCRVIGVLESLTSSKDGSKPNMNVILPWSYVETVAGSYWNSRINYIQMKVDSRADIIALGKKIKSYYEGKYGASGDFSVESDSELIAQMKKFLNLFAILLGAIAAISLAVGGIGINNMMLVAVTDRLREFGIRKALGATNRTIRLQVLTESVLLCAAAGVLGVILGFCAYELLIYGATVFVAELKFEWVFEPVAIILSFASIIMVGVLSGLAPAIKAEKLEIIEALRSE